MNVLRRARPAVWKSLLNFGRPLNNEGNLHTTPLVTASPVRSFGYCTLRITLASSLRISAQQPLQRSLVTLTEAQDQTDVAVQMQIDTLNDKFVEARDEIEYAVEDAETTYFNESHQTAKDAVAEATQLYQQVLNDLSEADRGKLQRSMGMKMEQLKAELGQLDSLHS